MSTRFRAKVATMFVVGLITLGGLLAASHADKEAIQDLKVLRSRDAFMTQFCKDAGPESQACAKWRAIR